MGKLRLATDSGDFVFIDDVETHVIGNFTVHPMLKEYHDKPYHKTKIFAVTYNPTGWLFCQNLTSKAAHELCHEITRNIKGIQVDSKKVKNAENYFLEVYGKVVYEKIITIRAKYLG